MHSFVGVLDGTAATLVGETESCHLVASSSERGGRSVGSFAGALVIFDPEFEIVGVTSNGFWGVTASFSKYVVEEGRDHVTGSVGQNKNAVMRVRTTAAPAVLRLCCARLMIADHSSHNREELLEKNRGESESGEVVAWRESNTVKFSRGRKSWRLLLLLLLPAILGLKVYIDICQFQYIL